MKTAFGIASLIAVAVLPLARVTSAAERADTYKIALERAKQTKASIAVFQRGSDWSHLGELLYNDVWNQPSFLKEVGGYVVLVAIDNPEVVGAPPVSKRAPEDAEPIYETTSNPSQRLRQKTQREIDDNAAFGWRGACTPRIALMDCEGRPVACENKPREALTVSSMAALIQQMEKVRVKRDALWQEAEKATGHRKAECYLDGLLAMGETIAFEGCYGPIHDRIRAADPDGSAGCSRRLMFPPDVRHVPPIVNDAYKLVDQKKFEEALAKIDAELKHPGNKRLTHENIQRIMIGKFHIYRRWPGREDKRYDVQREIHKFDPDTFWGIGALGYLWTFKQNAEPVSLPHGWEACHIKPGVNKWQLTYGVVPQFFDHPGNYTFRIFHRGGKDSVKIRQVTLLDGDKSVSSESPNAVLSPASSVEVQLTMPSWPPQGQLSVKLELEAEAGKTDVAGRFEVEPLL